MSLPFKKTFATKKSLLELKLLYFEIELLFHLVIKILIPFHSSLDDPTTRVRQQEKVFLLQQTNNQLHKIKLNS
jgi:hypothetical protein